MSNILIINAHEPYPFSEGKLNQSLVDLAREVGVEHRLIETFDLTPAGIIGDLKLKNPMYLPTAAYGHFGRHPATIEVADRKVDLFTWEDPTRAGAIEKEVLAVAKN